MSEYKVSSLHLQENPGDSYGENDTLGYRLERAGLTFDVDVATFEAAGLDKQAVKGKIPLSLYEGQYVSEEEKRTGVHAADLSGDLVHLRIVLGESGVLVAGMGYMDFVRARVAAAKEAEKFGRDFKAGEISTAAVSVCSAVEAKHDGSVLQVEARLKQALTDGNAAEVGKIAGLSDVQMQDPSTWSNLQRFGLEGYLRKLAHNYFDSVK